MGSSYEATRIDGCATFVIGAPFGQFPETYPKIPILMYAIILRMERKLFYIIDYSCCSSFVAVVRVTAGSEEGAAWRIGAASSALELLLVLASVADSVLSKGLSATERCWDWSSSMEGSVLIILWCGAGRGARRGGDCRFYFHFDSCKKIH